MADTTKPYQVAAYYFPNYHADARNERRHGAGWNEWELVKTATPRFPGHQQPRVPLWGYQDEADPAVFARKIDAAADHGIDTFLFDWYWYDDGPFLSRALDEGFLGAPNNDRMRFALMWANHNWVDIQPATIQHAPPLLYPGQVTRATFDQLTDHIIEHYFRHPSYWLIDGCPYFSVYELYRLIDGLGGLEATKDALDSFRQRTRQAGFPDLHLNGVAWGISLLPGEQVLTAPQQIIDYFGLQSVTSYVWIHDIALEDFPVTTYRAVAQAMPAKWEELATSFSVPYIPNVTMGWDASPRTRQDEPFINTGYPFMPTLGENTPAAFQQALEAVKTWLAQRDDRHKIVTINAWNEWTEGSYLEPDTEHGLAYLEAIRDVFDSAPAAELTAHVDQYADSTSPL